MACCPDGFDLRANDGPYFRPAFDATLADGGGMFVLANAGAVAIVVELDEIRPPPEKHGVTRCQQEINRGYEFVRPVFNGTERSLAPIESADELRHLALADNSRGVAFTERPRHFFAIDSMGQG